MWVSIRYVHLTELPLYLHDSFIFHSLSNPGVEHNIRFYYRMARITSWIATAETSIFWLYRELRQVTHRQRAIWHPKNKTNPTPTLFILSLDTFYLVIIVFRLGISNTSYYIHVIDIIGTHTWYFLLFQ